MKAYRLLLVPAVVALLLAGCDREGPAERAGEQIDQATERAGEKMESATERAGDKLESAGDRIEDKTDR